MSLISRIFSALHDNLNFKTIGLMMVAPSECCNATMMETTVNSDAFRKLQYHSFTNNTKAACTSAAANQNISSSMAVSPISATKSAVAQKSSLVSMLGNMVTPTERMVRVQLGDSFVATREQAAVAAAPIISSYALATMADRKSMTDSELTDCYVKFFSWLEPTQGMIMAHMRLAERDAEMAERAEEQNANSAHVKSRWESIVSALSQDNLTATRNVLMQQTQRKAGFFSRRFNFGSSYLVALGQH